MKQLRSDKAGIRTEIHLILESLLFLENHTSRSASPSQPRVGKDLTLSQLLTTPHALLVF